MVLNGGKYVCSERGNLRFDPTVVGRTAAAAGCNGVVAVQISYGNNVFTLFVSPRNVSPARSGSVVAVGGTVVPGGEDVHQFFVLADVLVHGSGVHRVPRVATVGIRRIGDANGVKPVVVVYLREVARVRIIDQISARCISPSARIFVSAPQNGAGYVVPVVALRGIGIIGQNTTGEIHVRSNVSVVAVSNNHTGSVVGAAAGVLVLDGIGAVVFTSYIVFRLRWGFFLLHKLNRRVCR